MPREGRYSHLFTVKIVDRYDNDTTWFLPAADGGRTRGKEEEEKVARA